jgi:hypothetical protein
LALPFALYVLAELLASLLLLGQHPPRAPVQP